MLSSYDTTDNLPYCTIYFDNIMFSFALVFALFPQVSPLIAVSLTLCFVLEHFLGTPSGGNPFGLRGKRKWRKNITIY